MSGAAFKDNMPVLTDQTTELDEAAAREEQWRKTTLEHLNRAYDQLQNAIANRSETARAATYSKYKLDLAEAQKTLELRDVKPEAVRTAQIRVELVDPYEDMLNDKLASMLAQSEFEIAEAEVDRVNAIYSIG